MRGTGGTDSIVATYGLPMPAVTTPTCVGHIFRGYWTTRFGNATGHKLYIASTGQSYSDWDKTEATATLYARWDPKLYLITLDRNGGSGGSETAYADFGSEIYSIVTPPTRDGYTFAGYFDTPAATGGEQFCNADGSSTRTFYFLTEPDGNPVLYARWELDGDFTVHTDGSITVYGQDGIEGTDDDLTIGLGVNNAVPEFDAVNGCITVPDGATVTGGTNNTDVGIYIGEGSIISDNGLVFIGAWPLVPENNGDGTITIPEGGAVFVYVPPMKEIIDPLPGEGTYYPEVPGLPGVPGIVIDEPPMIITIPDGVIIIPDDPPGPPGTGTIIIPGQDGKTNTVDDIIVPDGTYSNGYVVVNTGPATDIDGNAITNGASEVIGGPGAIIDDNGVIITDGTINEGGEVYLFVPPATLVGEGPGIYDPDIPAFIIPGDPTITIRIPEDVTGGGISTNVYHRITSISGCQTGAPVLGWDADDVAGIARTTFDGHIIAARCSLDSCGWVELDHDALGCCADGGCHEQEGVCLKVAGTCTATVPTSCECGCGKPYRFFKKAVKVTRPATP